MSSISPLAGRLCQIFSPRACIFVSSIIFALGAIVVSIAPALASFLVGRAVMGVGAAGIFTISIILVLELTDGERRGLFIGLINSGITASIALGAIIGGALVPTIGWVCSRLSLMFLGDYRLTLLLEGYFPHTSPVSRINGHVCSICRSQVICCWHEGFG
jgi:MFS family permease